MLKKIFFGNCSSDNISNKKYDYATSSTLSKNVVTITNFSDAQQKSYFLTLPTEIRLEILKKLNVTDLASMKKTCVVIRDDINAFSELNPIAYFNNYPFELKNKFYHLVQKKTEKGIRIWLNDFTDDENKINDILKNKGSPHFTEILFFELSNIMSKCRYFDIKKIKSIEHDEISSYAKISPDLREIMSVGKKYELISYDRNDPDIEQRLLIERKKFISGIAFTDDGRYHVVTDTDNKSIVYYNDNNGKRILNTIILHKGKLCATVFSADGRCLVTCVNGKNATAKIYSCAENGIFKLKGTISHDTPILKTAFSPDSHYVITSSFDGIAKIYSSNHGEEWAEKIIIKHKNMINDLVFSPDGYYVATASNDNSAKIRCLVNTIKYQEVTIHHNDKVSTVCFSPDSRCLVTASRWDDTATIYRRNDEDKWSKQQKIKGSVKNIAFSLDNRQLFIDAVIYRLGSNGKWVKKMTSDFECRNIIFSPDNRYILTMSTYCYIEKFSGVKIQLYCYDMLDGWRKQQTFSFSENVTIFAFSPDSRKFVIVRPSRTSQARSRSDCTIIIYGVDEHGKWIQKGEIEHNRSLRSISFTNDSCYLLGVSKSIKQQNHKHSSTLWKLIKAG